MTEYPGEHLSPEFLQKTDRQNPNKDFINYPLFGCSGGQVGPRSMAMLARHASVMINGWRFVRLHKPISLFFEHSTRNGHPRRLRPRFKIINQSVLDAWWTRTVGLSQSFATYATACTNWHNHERSNGVKSTIWPSAAKGHANKQCSHPICSAWAAGAHEGSPSRGFGSGEDAGQRYAIIGKLVRSLANRGTCSRTSSQPPLPKCHSKSSGVTSACKTLRNSAFPAVAPAL